MVETRAATPLAPVMAVAALRQVVAPEVAAGRPERAQVVAPGLDRKLAAALDRKRVAALAA